MSAENLLGNVPNKSFGEYQRPLPRDFEDASKGSLTWKNEQSTFGWDKMPVLPAGIFTSLDSSQTAVSDVIYIGNGDTTAVSSEWGAGVTQFDWLRYNGDSSSWGYITPQEGQLCYDTSSDSWYTYDNSTNGWIVSSVKSKQIFYTSGHADTGISSNIGYYATRPTNNATDYAMTTGFCPTDFKSLVSAKIIIISAATNSGTYTAQVEIGTIGENYNNHTANASAAISYTANKLAEIDITALMTNLNANDYFGVGLFENDIITNIHFLGVKLTYL